jgi:prefoldin subunit 5
MTKEAKEKTKLEEYREQLGQTKATIAQMRAQIELLAANANKLVGKIELLEEMEGEQNGKQS